MAKAPKKRERDIEHYAHPGKERVNNPPVGLVTPEADRDAGRRTWAHDPHIDPQLSWVGEAEHTSFEVPTVSLHVHERIDPRTVVEAVPAPVVKPLDEFDDAEPDAARIEAQGQADVMRIKARGQADSMGLIAKAQAEARNEFSVAGTSIQGKMDIGNEIDLRLTFQEQKRQSNIVSVVGLAADELGDKDVQDHDIDHDWVARFFSDAQDVTSEHMQRIWAKILAGEVETPGRTSLHTLAILKNMTQRDAVLFEKVSIFVFHDFILNKPENTNEIMEFPPLKILLDMENYGLLNANPRLLKTMKIPPEGYALVMGKTAYRISRDDVAFHEIEIPAFPLSSQGHELYSFTESSINENYLRIIASSMKDNGDFKLERVQIIEKMPANRFKSTPWILVEPLQSSQDDVRT